MRIVPRVAEVASVLREGGGSSITSVTSFTLLTSLTPVLALLTLVFTTLSGALSAFPPEAPRLDLLLARDLLDDSKVSSSDSEVSSAASLVVRLARGLVAATAFGCLPFRPGPFLAGDFVGRGRFIGPKDKTG